MKTLFFIAMMHIVIYANTKVVYKNSSGPAIKETHQANKNKIADTATLNGQWFLQAVLASDTAAGKIPALQIDLSSGTFSGNTGCNSMNGRFRKTDTSLIFNKDILTTKMLCTGYNENAFIKSLLQTNRYRIEKGVLILMFDETALSRWTRKPDRKIKIKTT